MSGTAPRDADERSVLLNAMAEESLTADQERRLNDLLRTDAGFRREYVLFCELLAQLSWETAAVRVGPVAPRNDGADLGGPKPPTAPPATSARRPSRGRIAALAASVMAVVLVVAWYGVMRWEASSPGTISGIAGRVEVVRGDQPAIVLGADDIEHGPWPLKADDAIRTDGSGTAMLRLADGTEMRVGSDAEVVLSHRSAARVTLWKGTLRASVAPQSARRPMTFTTPHADVRVLGTELELLAYGTRTEVAVTEGRVRVVRTTDRAEAEVAAGEFVSVKDSGPLSVIHWPRPPDVWDEDFEELPAGWSGRLVREGLPQGSRGALKGVAVNDARGRNTVAESPTRPQGLFAWHDDSVLHVTFRVQPPAWFHIYLVTRTYPQNESPFAWCLIDPRLWQAQPGEWRTVHIPLADFRPLGFEPERPSLGRIPIGLSVVGPGDLPGIEIDSLRVDRSELPPDSEHETSGGNPP